MADKESGGIGKGTPGPGRPKGTPNRATTAVRDAFRTLVEDNAPHFQSWLEKTAQKDPGRALELVSKLAEFITPRLARTDLRGAGEGGRLEVILIRQGGAPGSHNTQPPGCAGGKSD